MVGGETDRTLCRLTGAIMAQTGHKRADTLRKYIHLGSLFRENAAAQVGL